MVRSREQAPRSSGLERAGRGLALAGLAALLALAGLRLARKPCVGVADNLDYWRVARPAGIEVESERRREHHVVCSFPLAEADLLGGFSSAAAVAAFSRHVGWGLDRPAGSFDLRQLGLLYWAAAAVVLAGAVAAGLPPWLALLIAWVGLDPGFLLFFNSLYADPALVLGLLGTVAFLAVARLGGEPDDPLRRRLALAVVLCCAALAGFSKMQYSTFPLVLLACCSLALLLRRRRPDRFELAFLVLLASLAAAAPWHFFRGGGPRFLAANNYNAVYGGIARVASDPAAALAALGIPEEHRARPPGNFFADRAAGDPVLPHLRRLSRLRLAGLYLRDPGALLETAGRIEATIWRVRTHPRETWSREESALRSRPYATPEQFSVWRGRLLGRLPGARTVALLALATAVLAFRAWRREWTSRATVWLFLLLWTASQMAVAVLGEGFVNLHQHLVGSRLGFDLLLVLLLGEALRSLARAALAALRRRAARGASTAPREPGPTPAPG